MGSRWVCALVAVASLVAGCGDDSPEGEARNLGESESGTSSTGAGATTSSSVAGSATACEIQGGVTTKGTDVIVTLTEWEIAPAVAEAKAGIVAFVTENAGAEEHELVIVKGDQPEALPKNTDGSMDEAKLPEGALIGEIEPMGPGQLCRGNFALPAGPYVLLCNVAEEEADGTIEAHFAEGMYTTFTVT